jgi:hypothetical protein
VELEFHYLFTNNAIFGAFEHAGLMADFWLKGGSAYYDPPAMLARARRNALTGLHWIEGPEGYVVSANLATSLRRLVPRNSKRVFFYAVKLVDDKIAKAHLEFPKLRDRLP